MIFGCILTSGTVRSVPSKLRSASEAKSWIKSAYALNNRKQCVTPDYAAIDNPESSEAPQDGGSPYGT